MAQVLSADVKKVVAGSKVDQFIHEMEKDENTQVLMDPIEDTINYKGTQLLLKSRVVPAGVSSKTKQPYEAFTVVEVFRPGKVVAGKKVKPVGKAYPVYDKDDDGNSTDVIVGYRLRLKGYLKGGATAVTTEVTTPLFGLTYSVEKKFSEAKQKEYVALVDKDDDSIVGFCNDFYTLGMNFSYKVVVLKK